MGAKNSTPVIDIRGRRNSYDPVKRTLEIPRDYGKTTKRPLPHSHKSRQPAFNIRGKGMPFGAPKIKQTTRVHEDKIRFKTFDYESDFESEDEQNAAFLKKKGKKTLKGADRRFNFKDSEKAKEQRVRKYKELDDRHSGNSLQITHAPDEDRLSDPGFRNRFGKSPEVRHKQYPSSIPKSISYDRYLSTNADPTLDKRPSSLDRLQIGNEKKTFSRAPPQQQQQRKIVRSTGRSPLPHYKSVTPSSRKSTPGKGLESLAKGTPISEADIPTACYQEHKVLNTIHGRNFRPFNSPKDAYRSNTELLQSEEWEEQVEGIQTIARFAAFHSEIILANLKEINALLLKHAKNLRSQVSRSAIQTITQFFLSLKRNMEQDLEKTVALLLHKTSDTNKFLKEDSNCALDTIVEVATPSKVVNALIHEGLGHRNAQVRTTVCRLLAYLTERIGAGKAIAQRDIAEKLIPASAKLAQEGSLETRQMAKLIFTRLSTQSQFETALKKYLSTEEFKNIQKFLDNLNTDVKRNRDTSRNKAAKGGRFRNTM